MTPEDRIPVRECGEPMVDVRAAAPLRVVAGPGVRLRAGVVDRLVVAQSLLPRDLRLLIVAGHVQPGGDPVSHTTGAAVDLILYIDASPVAQCREPLTEALTAAGFVATTGWWHWSYGDREWARSTGARQARYGPTGT
jgi:D-alanyl-D-alanine dipeptidase